MDRCDVNVIQCDANGMQMACNVMLYIKCMSTAHHMHPHARTMITTTACVVMVGGLSLSHRRLALYVCGDH